MRCCNIRRPDVCKWNIAWANYWKALAKFSGVHERLKCLVTETCDTCVLTGCKLLFYCVFKMYLVNLMLAVRCSCTLYT